MKLSEAFVHPAGLFRCCAFSLDELASAQPDTEFNEGDKITCKYCKKPTLILHDGVFHTPMRLEKKLIGEGKDAKVSEHDVSCSV